MLSPDRHAPVEGLLSERQIVLPLVLAVLLTLALYLTLFHFYTPAGPGLMDRYLGNGFCRLIGAVFGAATLYAALQGLGLAVERYHLTLLNDYRLPPPGYGLACFLSGRRASDEDAFLHAARRWYGRARSQAALAQLADHLLLLRGQQHQHNLAPLQFTVWVLPLLGFIGTVIGISQAIGGLETAVDGNGTASLNQVLGGLSFAFDTTFLGLVLVIPTMLYTLPLRTRAEKLDLRYQEILLERLLAEGDPKAA
ncbi:MAG: MotA/TolQ/ExbB proton channel family protein [Candidatus Competibacteraceae bacterium]|nr:MotA/TolQ/ExbB proton channel family protein [Candidatus Competibacteraceae bacterium]